MVVHEKLRQNYRCLYLHSLPMVAGMRSYLAAAGVDVAYETARTSLVLSSEPEHLVDGRFSVHHMIKSLNDSVDRALHDGYEGLWATGDITWEFGSEQDFSRLVEYEWRLEELFRQRPQLGGICLYHTDTLPREVVRQGLHTHPQLFISETLTLINPDYLSPAAFTSEPCENPEIHSPVSPLPSRKATSLPSAFAPQ